jgi:hypothetical protein
MLVAHRIRDVDRRADDLHRRLSLLFSSLLSNFLNRKRAFSLEGLDRVIGGAGD